MRERRGRDEAVDRRGQLLIPIKSVIKNKTGTISRVSRKTRAVRKKIVFVKFVDKAMLPALRSDFSVDRPQSTHSRRSPCYNGCSPRKSRRVDGVVCQDQWNLTISIPEALLPRDGGMKSLHCGLAQWTVRCVGWPPLSLPMSSAIRGKSRPTKA